MEDPYRNKAENQEQFEVAFEQVNPDEPSPIEVFSARNTLERLKTNLEDWGEVPEKFQELVTSLDYQGILRAMQLIQTKSLDKGWTVPMLYSEELDFTSKFQEQSEIANPDAQDPFEYFANRDELVAWLLLFTKSFQHGDESLDVFQKQISPEGNDEYASFLEEYKSSAASSYARVMRFREDPFQDHDLQAAINQQVRAHLESNLDLDKKEDVVVVREAGMGEAIDPFLERYNASKIVLVDPKFSEEEYQRHIEENVRKVDPQYSKEKQGTDTIFTFTYEGKKREVILKPIMLDAESVKEVPVPDIYEMGNASVEGTRSLEYLSSLYDHMGKQGVIIDLFRHAREKVYREFVKENEGVVLTAFSAPVDKKHLYNVHAGAEPGYRVMLSFEKREVDR